MGSTHPPRREVGDSPTSLGALRPPCPTPKQERAKGRAWVERLMSSATVPPPITRVSLGAGVGPGWRGWASAWFVSRVPGVRGSGRPEPPRCPTASIRSWLRSASSRRAFPGDAGDGSLLTRLTYSPSRFMCRAASDQPSERSQEKLGDSASWRQCSAIGMVESVLRG